MDISSYISLARLVARPLSRTSLVSRSCALRISSPKVRQRLGGRRRFLGCVKTTIVVHAVHPVSNIHSFANALGDCSNNGVAIALRSNGSVATSGGRASCIGLSSFSVGSFGGWRGN